MSRYFDILRRAGLTDALLLPSTGDEAPSLDGVLGRELTVVEADAAKPGKRNVLLPEIGDEPIPGGRRERQLPPSEQAHEEVVKLVQRLFGSPNSAPTPRLVVFSNVDNGRGSSDMCIRSGEMLAAQLLGSVCLVDANLHAPALHHLLGIDRVPGLVDAIVSTDSIRDFAAQIDDGNLWVVPAGSPLAGAQDLLASDKLRSRMAELKEQFDYILIDSPPVNSYSDATRIGQLADGAILVVEANSTRREAARMAKQTLRSAHVKLLGAILNNRTFPIPEALYRTL